MMTMDIRVQTELAILEFNSAKHSEDPRDLVMATTKLDELIRRNKMKESNKIDSLYKVGEQVTVQFGNKSDSSGYTENVPCTVEAVQKNLGGFMYLVRKVDNKGYLGAAIDPIGTGIEGRVEGQLYCTNAREYGDVRQSWTGIDTEDKARRSLGFM